MKQKTFAGVAVHPRRISTERRDMVGVWLGRRISSDQRRRLLDINHDPLFVSGHIAVAVDQKTGTTAVKYLGRIKTPKIARDAATALMRAVRNITGRQCTLLCLPNYRSVSRALAL